MTAVTSRVALAVSVVALVVAAAALLVSLTSDGEDQPNATAGIERGAPTIGGTLPRESSSAPIAGADSTAAESDVGDAPTTVASDQGDASAAPGGADSIRPLETPGSPVAGPAGAVVVDPAADEPAGAVTLEPAGGAAVVDPAGAVVVVDPAADEPAGAVVVDPAGGVADDFTVVEPAGAVVVDPAAEPVVEPTGALAGEPYEFGPLAGTGLAVVGVAHDDVLNVRDEPNGKIVARLKNVMGGPIDHVLKVLKADSDDILSTLDLNRGVVATGNTRKLPTTVWHEVRVGHIVGWASAAFLAPLGTDRDATSEVLAALGGATTAETMSELGLRVASDAFASFGEVRSLITIASPTALHEGLGEVTVDVLGRPDDSVRGYRVSVAAAAEDWMRSDPGPFRLQYVGATPICYSHRGASAGGLCH